MSTQEAEMQEETATEAAPEQAAEAEEGSGSRGEQAADRARVHDFARSEGLPTAMAQALEGACVSFARGTSGELSSYLHAPFEVALVSLDQVSYEEYVRSVPEATVIGAFTMKPLPGRGTLELSPAIAFWIVDRLLGGEGEVAEGSRPLTEVERALIEGMLSRMLGELGTAWQELGSLEPELLDILDSAESAEIGKRTDAVAAASFEMKVAGMTERASICLPVISLKVGRVGSREGREAERSSGDADAASLRRRLARALGSVPVTCAVRLGSATISARELAALQEGDMVCLERRADEELEMFVGHARKFRCRPVAGEDRVAVEILGEAS